MNNEKNILDQAVKVFSESTIPTGPSDDLVRQTLAQIEKEQTTIPFMERIVIDQWMRVAAVIAILCCAGLGILVTLLVRTNALFSTIALMASCVNSITYVGGLFL